MVHGIAYACPEPYLFGDLARIEVLCSGRRSPYSFSFLEEQCVRLSGIELLGGTERNILFGFKTLSGQKSKISNHGDSLLEFEKRNLAFASTLQYREGK